MTLNYLHGQKQPSRKSKLIYHILKTTKGKARIFKKLTSNPPRNNGKLHRNKISPKLIVSEHFLHDCKIITLKPSRAGTQHIILLHGGAYVAEAVKGHRILLEKLALDHGFTVTFIDYPLAPENQASHTLHAVMKVYRELHTLYPNDAFFLLGDSAGGGLALSLLQALKAAQIARRPSKTVLLSPWLDLRLQHPDIDHYIEKDVVLSLEGLKICGKQYAGDLASDDPIVSPIRGDLSHLRHVKLYVSSHEIFYPDCMLLSDLSKVAVGTKVDLSVKYHMLHDWVIFPIPERDETIKEIAGFFSEAQ